MHISMRPPHSLWYPYHTCNVIISIPYFSRDKFWIILLFYPFNWFSQNAILILVDLFWIGINYCDFAFPFIMCSIDECFAKVYFGNELIFGCMSNVLHFYYIIANGAFTNPVPSRTFIQKIIKFQKHLKIIVNMFYSLRYPIT